MKFFEVLLISTIIAVAKGIGDTCKNKGIPCGTNDESGTCIVAKQFCDGFTQCPNGTDEPYYNKSSDYEEQPNRALCRSRSENGYKCILRESLMPRKKDLCHDNSSCPYNEFSCGDGSRCLKKNSFCNNDPDCIDKSDEIREDPNKPIDGRFCSGAEATGHRCELPKSYICDGISLCFDDTDECLCGDDEKYFMDKSCFRCLSNRGYVIPISKMCDKVFDCPDFSDECICEPRIRPEICKNLIYGENDTLQLSCDNQDGHLITVQRRMICDSSEDCNDGIDERDCRPKEEVVQNSGPVQSKKRKTFWCPDQCRIYATQCDGIPECIKFQTEECAEKCQPQPAFCGLLRFDRGLPKCRKDGKNVTVSPSEICDGRKFCHDDEDENRCGNRRFYCTDRPLPNIPTWRTCDKEDDCDNGKDEADCQHYRCDDNGTLKYLDMDSKCDGIKDCLSGNDECHKECFNSTFSDGKEMIANTAMFALVWIISIFAILGCSTVIGMTIWSLSRTRPTSGPNSVSDHTRLVRRQILSLSLSDFVVGIYTLSICIEAQMLDDCYAVQSRIWRGSYSCSALGFILVTGSEQSVFTMVLIAMQRVRAVVRPFSQPNINRETAALLMAWFIAIMIGLVPLLPRFEDYFVTRIEFTENRIFKAINNNETEYMVTILGLMHHHGNKYGSSRLAGTTNWGKLANLVNDVNPNISITYKFGYYSSHAVCLPTFFPDPEVDTAWGYTVFLLLVNFIAFLFMLFSYIILYNRAVNLRVVVEPQSALQEKRARQNKTMQRKLTRIVFSDFLCWMPICLMGIMKVAGIPISNDVYIPSALIIVPINSALNPFLYSDLPDIIWGKMRNAVVSTSCTTKTTEDPVKPERLPMQKLEAKQN